MNVLNFNYSFSKKKKTSFDTLNNKSLISFLLSITISFDLHDGHFTTNSRSLFYWKRKIYEFGL